MLYILKRKGLRDKKTTTRGILDLCCINIYQTNAAGSLRKSSFTDERIGFDFV